MDKTKYRAQCRLLAGRCASMKLDVEAIPSFLSTQKWFMQAQGLHCSKTQYVITAKGAIGSFGREWCEKCWKEELLRTGMYEEVSGAIVRKD